MSKKKNTLKDLDEFLKQQAATLVEPTRLAEEKSEVAKPEVVVSEQSTQETILQSLRALSKESGTEFRANFYNLILKAIEEQPQSRPEDKMLVNTVLYLQHQDNWKDAIRQYWKNKG
jgi:hypothetical protein